jgi:hypothetical protein
MPPPAEASRPEPDGVNEAVTGLGGGRLADVRPCRRHRARILDHRQRLVVDHGRRRAGSARRAAGKAALDVAAEQRGAGGKLGCGETDHGNARSPGDRA